MAKLTIGSIREDKPVKMTIELPAEVDRDLRAYAEILKCESGQTVGGPRKAYCPDGQALYGN